LSGLYDIAPLPEAPYLSIEGKGLSATLIPETALAGR